MKTAPTVLLLSAALLGALANTSALADRRGPDRVETRVEGRMVFDTRYHHDRYYPATGWVTAGLPRGSVTIHAGPSPYYFHGGVWYRPDGPRYRVVLPPLGLIVPVLPWAYVTLQVGGLPYFYANGVYYQHAPGGYAVVAAPANAEAAQPVNVPPARPDPIVYPRNGQSAQQQEADRQECNRWATSQPAAMSDASIFQRSVEACMDGRGYTMK